LCRNFVSKCKIPSDVSFLLISERGPRRCDQRFGVPGRAGHQEDGVAQNERGLREEHFGLENSGQRPLVHREDTRPPRQGSDHRRSPPYALGRQAPRPGHNTQGCK
ncbi:hypothetical protein AAG570_011731, partial [Ranatra chinensis]